MELKLDNSKLTQISKEVPENKIPEAIEYAKEMVNFCRGKELCLGASAVQFGRLDRMYVAKIRGIWNMFINPVVMKKGNATIRFKEGCISYPGQFKEIKRSKKIWISYIDHTGKRKTERFVDLHSVIMQHEVDHLAGIICMHK
jgi:peptide deformylase